MNKKSLLVIFFVVPLFSIISLSISSKVYAGTCQWNGSSDNNWNTAANWDPGCTGAGGIPGDGDTIEFPNGASNTTNVNNISGLDLYSINFIDGNYTVTGNSITLEDSLIGGDASVSISLDITLTDNVVISSSFAIHSYGTIDLNNFQLNLDSSNDVQIHGTITGNGILVSSGSSRVEILGDNDFIGDIILEDGSSIYFGSSTWAGNSSNIISSIGNGYIGFDGHDITMENDIHLSGSSIILSFGANNVLNGDIVIDNNMFISSEFSGSELTLNGVISGSGNLTTSGDGTITIAGNSSNTFTGEYLLAEGTTYLAKTGTALALSGSSVTIADTDTFTAQPAVLVISDDEQIANSATILINPDGRLNATQNETFLTLSGAGRLSVGDGVFMAIYNVLDTTFSGVIDGTGDIQKVGSGDLTLSGNSPDFTGLFYIPEGPVTVTGNLTGCSIHLQGGSIAGTGTVKDVIGENGYVDPGLSNSPGLLILVGSLNLNSEDTINIQLNGSNAGSEYDKLSVAGDVDLGGATLDLDLGYTPVKGSIYIILQSAGIISNEFAGLPNFSLIEMGGETFVLTYTEHAVQLSIPNELLLLEFSQSSNSTQYGYLASFHIKWGSSGDIIPTGTAYLVDGSTQIASGTLINGEITFNLYNLSVGSHSLHTEYSGDDNFNGAISGSIIHIVTAPVFVGAQISESISQNTIIPSSYPSNTPISYTNEYQDTSSEDLNKNSNSYDYNNSTDNTINNIILVALVVVILLGGIIYISKRIK